MNGLKIQWGSLDTSQDVSTKIDFLITYTQIPTVILIPRTSSLDRDNRYMCQVYDVNKSYFYGYYNSAKQLGMNWLSIGY